MRQNASDLVRRAEAGERLTITVSGRPAAVLGPVGPQAWRQWSDVADVFSAAVDDDWAHDQELVGGGLADPWERRPTL